MDNTTEQSAIIADLQQLAQVSNTLFIPLKGRSKARLKNDGFEDPWAQKLFQDYPIPTPNISSTTVGFSICRAKWLDLWAKELLLNGGTLIQLGPGLCSRSQRLYLNQATLEIDLPAVISLKKKLYQFPNNVHLEAIDFLNPHWCQRALEVGPPPYVMVMEGVSMYLPKDYFKKMLQMMADYFTGSGHLLFDYVAPIISRHTILLPSVFKTGARFSGNGFNRKDLHHLHPQFKLEKHLALPALYLPPPLNLFAKLYDGYSLAHMTL